MATGRGRRGLRAQAVAGGGARVSHPAPRLPLGSAAGGLHFGRLPGGGRRAAGMGPYGIARRCQSLADAIVTLCEPGANEKARALARVAAKERTWQRSADTVLALLEQVPA